MWKIRLLSYANCITDHGRTLRRCALIEGRGFCGRGTRAGAERIYVYSVCIVDGCQRPGGWEHVAGGGKPVGRH